MNKNLYWVRSGTIAITKFDEALQKSKQIATVGTHATDIRKSEEVKEEEFISHSPSVFFLSSFPLLPFFFFSWSLSS